MGENFKVIFFLLLFVVFCAELPDDRATEANLVWDGGVHYCSTFAHIKHGL